MVILSADVIGFGMILLSKALLITAANIVKRFCPLSVIYILLCRHIIECLLSVIGHLITAPKSSMATVHYWMGPASERFYSLLRGVLYWCFIYCYYLGLRAIPFSHATIIMSTKSLIVALASFVFNNEAIPVGFTPAMILCLSGVIVAMKLHDHSDQSRDTQYWNGVVCTVLGTVFVALQPILVRKTRGTRVLQSLLIQCSVAAIIMSPSVLVIIWISEVGFSGLSVSLLVELWDSVSEYWLTLCVVGTFTFSAWSLDVGGYRMIRSAALGSLANFCRLPLALEINSIFRIVFTDLEIGKEESIDIYQWCGVALIIAGCALPRLLQSFAKGVKSKHS